MNRKNLMGSVVVLMMSAMPAFAGWEALPEVAPAPADNPTTEAKVTLRHISTMVQSMIYLKR